MRTAMRKRPCPSVTATNVLPESMLIAVTVTPGSTPPVESVIVPVMVASCAWDTRGKTSRIPSANTQRMCRFTLPSLDRFVAAGRIAVCRRKEEKERCAGIDVGLVVPCICPGGRGCQLHSGQSAVGRGQEIVAAENPDQPFGGAVVPNTFIAA